jgi:hypothetical protein
MVVFQSYVEKTSLQPDVKSEQVPWLYIKRNTRFVKSTEARRMFYLKSFLVRTSRIWNTLIDAIDLHTDSLAVFKSCLLNYYFTSVDITYNPENPRTFRSLCLKCNSVRSLASPISCCY